MEAKTNCYIPQRAFACSNTRTRCDICTQLTIKTPERRECMIRKLYRKVLCHNFKTSFKRRGSVLAWLDVFPSTFTQVKASNSASLAETNVLATKQSFTDVQKRILKKMKKKIVHGKELIDNFRKFPERCIQGSLFPGTFPAVYLTKMQYTLSCFLLSSKKMKQDFFVLLLNNCFSMSLLPCIASYGKQILS